MINYTIMIVLLLLLYTISIIFSTFTNIYSSPLVVFSNFLAFVITFYYYFQCGTMILLLLAVSTPIAYSLIPYQLQYYLQSPFVAIITTNTVSTIISTATITAMSIIARLDSVTTSAIISAVITITIYTLTIAVTWKNTTAITRYYPSVISWALLAALLLRSVSLASYWPSSITIVI